MKYRRRIWLGVSLLASGVAQAGEGSAGVPGDFENVLSHILGGEGGEGGLGMSRLDDGRIVVPALNAAQLGRTLSDVTLRRDRQFAMHFEADGSFSGWEVAWSKVDVAKCTPDAGKGFSLEDGVCWQSAHVKVPEGKWTVKDDRLCTQPALSAAAEGEPCVSLVFLLDNVAAFRPDGSMVGKGFDIVPGNQPEETRVRK